MPTAAQSGAIFSLLSVGLALAVLAHSQGSSFPRESPAAPGKFTDVSNSVGVHFQYLAEHTPKKYLLETMGAGVALFDFDNDGRLDIFLVNGAPITAPMPKDAIPQKTGPNTGIVSITKSPMARSKMSPRKPDCREKATAWE